jgi:phosphatidate cytidylyltransferase
VLLARIATAAVLIAALLAALFLLPPAAFIVLVAFIVGAAGFEWARLCRIAGWRTWLYAALAAILCAVTGYAGITTPVAAIGAAFWLVVAPIWLARGMQPAHCRLLAAAGMALLVPAGAAMMALTPAQLLLSFGLIWIADTFAYFAGRRFGRHKLAPAISPSKTWEGAAGGVFGTLAYAIICAEVLPALRGISGGTWAAYIAATLGLCTASIVGDLFESAAKRQAGVKDSGAILPGHGGILDRIDSATCTLPFAALLWPLIGTR